MPSADAVQRDRPILFCLHNLGGSGREWASVADLLAARVRTVTIDLPGFGESTGAAGYDVAAMADHVSAAIAAARPARYLLAGHSMGGKVTSVLARRAEDGDPALAGLVGVVLVAASPPSPEPMAEEQRQKMLGWFDGDDAERREDAERYVDANSGDDLGDAARAAAVNDALRLRRRAWTAWLAAGSREDWSARVGVLDTPAVIAAGGDDDALGPDGQRERNLPHYARGRFEVLPGAKHLLPAERTADVARLIGELLDTIDDEPRALTALEAAYRELIASPRVSSATRGALLSRAQPDDPAYAPRALDARGLTVLRAIAARVVPQPHDAPIDLAARIDARLASGASDGWRFAALPPDADAYRAGLTTLDALARHAHGLGFAETDPGNQDALLARAAAGELASEGSTDAARLDASQLKLWFQDVRANCVQTYVAHPNTLARIGYSGIANGGNGEPKSGFSQVGVDRRESWEPVAASEPAS